MFPTTRVSKFNLLSNVSFEFTFIFEICRVHPTHSVILAIISHSHRIDEVSYTICGNAVPKPFLEPKDW